MKNLASGLKILLILLIGVQTLISCSSDDSSDGGGNETSSSSVAGTQSSSSDANPSSSSIGECVGADNICPSSSSAQSSSSGNSSSSSNDDGNSSSSGNGNSSSSVVGGSPFQVNSQIYVWNSDREDSSEEYTGGGEIKISLGISEDCSGEDCYCNEDDQCRLYISAGTVTNGIVNLNLPSTIPDKYLREFGTSPEGISFAPSDVKYYMADERVYLLLGTDFRQIMIVSRNDGHTKNPSYEDLGALWYFSKAATMTGKFVENRNGCDRETTYDINANAGWNIVYQTKERTEEESCAKYVYIASTNNIFVKEAKWFIFP